MDKRLHNTAIKHIGEQFGNCTCIGRVLDSNDPNYGKYVYKCGWCGNEFIRERRHLVDTTTHFPDRIISCGCQESINRQNGMLASGKSIGGLHNHPLYQEWHGIINRCIRGTVEFENYGGRAINPITICDEWMPGDDLHHGNSAFLRFYTWAIAAGWKEGLSLDRRNNNGPYAPWNCYWATRKEQMNNRSVSIRIEYRRKVYTPSQFERAFDLETNTTSHLRRILAWKAARYMYEKTHPGVKIYRDSNGTYYDQMGNIRTVPQVLFFPLYPDAFGDKVNSYFEYMERLKANTLDGIETRTCGFVHE